MFPGSHRTEQLSLRSQQRVVDTVEESVLKTEMAGLESQEGDAPFHWFEEEETQVSPLLQTNGKAAEK
jgi:hypothetical protein